MTARIAAWIRKQPLLAFYLLAFGMTWLGWMPQAAWSRGLFPFDSPLFYILGGMGPLFAVFLVLRALHGQVDYLAVFRPLWQASGGAIWYAVALFGYPAMWLAALAPGGGLKAGLAGLGAPAALLSAFPVAFLAAIPEEIAWRGFALPRLQARYSALVASLVAGLLWALWHLPLLLNTDNLMSTYPVGLFVLDVLARSVVYTWIFNNTRGSLLFVTLFHAASNTVGRFEGIENVVVSWALAGVLILVFGAAHLARRGERAVVEDSPTAVAGAD